MSTPAKTNSLAIVSLVCGVASWVIAPVAASVVGIICGHMARAQIRRTGEEGDQLAVIGLALSYVHLVSVCIGFIIVFAIFGGAILAFLGLGGAAALQHAH